MMLTAQVAAIAGVTMSDKHAAALMPSMLSALGLIGVTLSLRSWYHLCTRACLGRRVQYETAQAKVLLRVAYQDLVAVLVPVCACADYSKP